jgi:hypothetical protein
MTVKELIELLSLHNPDLKVVARGYEDGWDDIRRVQALNVVHEPNNSWYSGKYQSRICLW